MMTSCFLRCVLFLCFVMVAVPTYSMSHEHRILIQKANDGDEVAQDTLAQQIADELIYIRGGKDLTWVTTDIITKKIATTYGYLDIFDRFFSKKSTEDIAEVIKLLEKEAENDNKIAQCNMGSIYHIGLLGIEKNETKAIAWFLKSAEQGNAIAQCFLGSIYNEKNKEKEALDWLQLAVAQDQVNAQYVLGTLYAQGKGIEKDEKKAVFLYTAAAEKGLRQAQYCLSCMYAHGHGTARDEREALMWLLKSGTCHKDENAKGYIQNHLQRIGTAITDKNTIVCTYYNLREMTTYFEEVMLHEHRMGTFIYEPDDGKMVLAIENYFPILSLHKAYNALYAFEEKTIKILNLFMKTETGFMVNCVKPTKILAGILKKSTSTALSEIEIGNRAFMLFGHKNHEIWKALLAFVGDMRVGAGIEALNIIEAPYTSKHMKELHALREVSIEKLSKNKDLKDELIDAFMQKSQEEPGDDDVIKDTDIPLHHKDTRVVLGQFDALMRNFFKPHQVHLRNQEFLDEQFIKE